MDEVDGQPLLHQSNNESNLNEGGANSNNLQNIDHEMDNMDFRSLESESRNSESS